LLIKRIEKIAQSRERDRLLIAVEKREEERRLAVCSIEGITIMTNVPRLCTLISLFSACPLLSFDNLLITL
jgi:hypothetical protein